ncbi:MAG: radical SAM protein [Treponema sp.]|nr:radical SAM protein [Treponema sp.]
MIVVNEVEARSLLTRTRVPAGDYVINPYIGCPHKCMYCYAEYMKHFTNHGEAWGDFLDVKRCDRAINMSRLRGKTVVLSSTTDAYNPFERKFEATRGILKQFIHTEVHVEIMTKSDLVLRDRDLFKEIPNIRIGVSLNTLDDGIRKQIEPGAPSIENRIKAIRTLHEEGFDTYIFLSPLFPGISDFREILDACKDSTRMFYFENLNLRDAYRPRVINYIRRHHTVLLPLYNEIYTGKNTGYWAMLEQQIADYCQEHKIRYKSYFYHEKIRKQ